MSDTPLSPIESPATALPAAGQVARICNTGSADANLNFGTTNAVAARR